MKRHDLGLIMLVVVTLSGANAAYGIIYLTIENSEWLRGLGSFFSFLSVLVFAVWKVDDYLIK